MNYPVSILFILYKLFAYKVNRQWQSLVQNKQPIKTLRCNVLIGIGERKMEPYASKYMKNS